MKKAAVLGLGNMGGMIAEKIVANGIVSPEDVNIFDRHPEKMESINSKNPGYNICETAKKAVSDAKNIFLCIQSKYIPELIKDIAGDIKEGSCLYISTANIKFADAAKLLPGKVGKFLPTVLSSINRGVIYSCFNDEIKEDDKDFFNKCIGTMCSKVKEIEEEDFDVLDSLGGLTPAFFAYMCDAMTDAAMKLQNKYSKEELSGILLENFAGTGQWLLESGKSFEIVAHNVGHPGGITYESLSALKETLPGAFDEMMKRGIKRRREQSEDVTEQIEKIANGR